MSPNPKAGGMGEAGESEGERESETVFGDDDVAAGEFVGRSVPVAATLVYPGRLKEKERFTIGQIFRQIHGAPAGAHAMVQSPEVAFTPVPTPATAGAVAADSFAMSSASSSQSKSVNVLLKVLDGLSWDDRDPLPNLPAQRHLGSDVVCGRYQQRAAGDEGTALACPQRQRRDRRG